MTSVADKAASAFGTLPEDWLRRRLRFDAQLNPKKSLLDMAPDELVSFVPMDAVGEYGGMSLDEVRELEDVYESYTYFANGDLCVAKITPCFENGKGALAEGLTNGVGFGTTELHVIRPKESLDRRFLFYVTMADDFRKLGESEMYGAGGQKRINEGFIKDWMPPLPPLNTQQRIAQFLDEKTAQIDELIEKKRALLDRLAEKFNNQEKELATVHSLRIAFEMEPGPLYLLDGPRSLLRFCHLIESHTSPLVRKCVGFNLDIAHWWLKNITPDFLDQPYQFLDRRSPNNEPSVTAFGHAAPNLKNRIFHSHISGHSRRAHFGYISLTRMVEEDKQLYCQWLTKLIELVQQDGSRFSSYVSLEYEAARNLQCVIESADELVNLLAQAQDKYASSRLN